MWSIVTPNKCLLEPSVTVYSSKEGTEGKGKKEKDEWLAINWLTTEEQHKNSHIYMDAR